MRGALGGGDGHRPSDLPGDLTREDDEHLLRVRRMIESSTAINAKTTTTEQGHERLLPSSSLHHALPEADLGELGRAA
jgi:hypothetical protein